MASSSEANPTTKPGGRRKRNTEIKKVEQLNRRHVTFSKRKLGLFNKVTELSILCQAKTALIVTSPNGKLYACGYPSPDAVIRRFLSGGAPLGDERTLQQQQEEAVETLRVQYEAIQDQLKEEKKNLQAITEAQKGTSDGSSSSSFPCWWDQPIEDMGLECLEDFKTCMEHLRLNLVTALEGKRINSLPPLPLAVAPPPPQALPEWSLLSDDHQCYGTAEQQLQEWQNGNTSGSSGGLNMIPGFGQYY